MPKCSQIALNGAVAEQGGAGLRVQASQRASRRFTREAYLALADPDLP